MAAPTACSMGGMDSVPLVAQPAPATGAPLTPGTGGRHGLGFARC